MTGALVRALVAVAVAPAVAVLDLALEALNAYDARRQAPRLVAMLEAELAEAAR